MLLTQQLIAQASLAAEKLGPRGKELAARLDVVGEAAGALTSAPRRPGPDIHMDPRDLAKMEQRYQSLKNRSTDDLAREVSRSSPRGFDRDKTSMIGTLLANEFGWEKVETFFQQRGAPLLSKTQGGDAIVDVAFKPPDHSKGEHLDLKGRPVENGKTIGFKTMDAADKFAADLRAKGWNVRQDFRPGGWSSTRHDPYPFKVTVDGRK